MSKSSSHNVQLHPKTLLDHDPFFCLYLGWGTYSSWWNFNQLKKWSKKWLLLMPHKIRKIWYCIFDTLVYFPYFHYLYIFCYRRVRVEDRANDLFLFTDSASFPKKVSKNLKLLCIEDVIKIEWLLNFPQQGVSIWTIIAQYRVVTEKLLLILISLKTTPTY